MPLFIWKPSYEIGVNAIDMQHRQLVGMINELYEAMKVGHGQDAVVHVLHELVDYVQLHFNTEEEIMRDHYYPGLEEHVLEHLELTRHVMDFAEEQRTGQRIKTIDLMNFLRDWLTEHITVRDKKFGEFLQRRSAILFSDG